MANIFSQTFNLLGGLALFLFGIKAMSDGLQKLSGTHLRHLLQKATTNRFSATACGALITGIIQSSSATTVMVVGFAAAGLLSLHQALGVIFGANIGTTLTAWIVSLFGFKLDISLFALPVIAIGFFIQCVDKWPTFKRIGETLLGFGILFFGLSIMKNAIPADLTQHPQVISFISKWAPVTLGHLLLLIAGGTILTVILQSSSAIMAMTLTCAAAGIIDFPTSCALVLGENIGTTITANIAALGSSNTARRAALGHTLFNTIGVLWAIIFFPYLVRGVDALVPGNPYVKNPAILTAVLPYHIAAFHTLFNVVNTALLLPLLNQLAALTFIFIPKSKRENEKSHELIYLSNRFATTPELSFIAARKEIERMLQIVIKMTDKIIYAVKTDDDKLFTRLIADIKEGEQSTDILEHKINIYLTRLAHGNLSRQSVAKAVALFDILNNVERMADAAEKVSRILDKFHLKGSFSNDDKEDIITIAQLTKRILKRTQSALGDINENRLPSLFEEALEDEKALNTLRKTLLHNRRERTAALTGASTHPDTVTAYADILSNFELTGDYALRTVEHLTQPTR